MDHRSRLAQRNLDLDDPSSLERWLVELERSVRFTTIDLTTPRNRNVGTYGSPTWLAHNKLCTEHGQAVRQARQGGKGNSTLVGDVRLVDGELWLVVLSGWHNLNERWLARDGRVLRTPQIYGKVLLDEQGHTVRIKKIPDAWRSMAQVERVKFRWDRNEADDVMKDALKVMSYPDWLVRQGGP